MCIRDRPCCVFSILTYFSSFDPCRCVLTWPCCVFSILAYFSSFDPCRCVLTLPCCVFSILAYFSGSDSFRCVLTLPCCVFSILTYFSGFDPFRCVLTLPCCVFSSGTAYAGGERAQKGDRGVQHYAALQGQGQARAPLHLVPQRRGDQVQPRPAHQEQQVSAFVLVKLVDVDNYDLLCARYAG